MSLPFGGAAWYSLGYEGDKMMSDLAQAADSRDRLAECIRAAVEAYDADPQGVWLLGFSQGAILSYGILSKYPSLVRHYIPLSGYVEPGVIDPSVRAHRLFGGAGLGHARYARSGYSHPGRPRGAGFFERRGRGFPLL